MLEKKKSTSLAAIAADSLQITTVFAFSDANFDLMEFARSLTLLTEFYASI